MLRHVFVPSSGLDENDIKDAFYPGVPLAAFVLPTEEDVNKTRLF